MRLSTLLGEIPLLKINGAPAADWLSTAGRGVTGAQDPDIGSIHYRSQDVKPGGLFVAIEGHRTDGNRYVDDAIGRGALAIVSRKPLHGDVVTVEVENPRQALSGISAAFYRHPSDRLFVIGITGTNGKTTTAYLLESILSASGYRTGVIGTINYRYAGHTFANPVTTPESLDLHRILATMLAAGVSHVVLEVSSHAVDLKRVDHCRFDIGIFTNLTQDHLDYHHDMEAYWACKKKFFTELLAAGPKKKSAAAVINCDNPYGQELAGLLDIRTLSTGHGEQAAIRPRDARIDRTGICATITSPAGDIPINSALIGRHNLDNLLAAAGAGTLLGIPCETIGDACGKLACVPGRLERVTGASGRFVYVDYAHTPDALENVLTALRPLTKGRLICVFGCGGDRDRTKRPQMGQIAGALCDLAVITSDNPRTELPLAIIEEIRSGIRLTRSQELAPPVPNDAGARRPRFIVIADRRQAIQTAVSVSRAEDTVLIAGKGHETYQIIGRETLPFDDREEALRALDADDGAAQPVMLETPCC